MPVLDLDQYATDRGLSTREDMIFSLRQDYCTALGVASIVNLDLRAKDPQLVEYIDREMAWFFDDLGNCFYDCWDGVRNAMGNGHLLATGPTTGDLRGKFAGLPAIVLGAGPGAADRWDAIKASRGHAVLIVCDVMLHACLARGIVPDFVSAIERVPATYETMVGPSKAGMTLVAPPVIEPRVVDDFGGNVIWCWRGCGLETWVDHRIPRNNFGRSCGVQGIAVALLAGCSPVYLVGHDLCMQGGATHCGGAHEQTNATAGNLDRDEYHRRSPAKSISGRDVETIHLWGMFKSDIEHIAKEHPAQIVINTGDGLAIEATQHGEVPMTWGKRIELPRITRETPGNDPKTWAKTMLLDLEKIEKRCREVLAADVPDHESLRLTTMVDRETAGVWTEIYGSTYCAALIRLHLQPKQHHDMLRRVANTIIHTLPHLRKDIDALVHP